MVQKREVTTISRWIKNVSPLASLSLSPPPHSSSQRSFIYRRRVPRAFDARSETKREIAVVASCRERCAPLVVTLPLSLSLNWYFSPTFFSLFLFFSRAYINSETRPELMANLRVEPFFSAILMSFSTFPYEYTRFSVFFYFLIYRLDLDGTSLVLHQYRR